MENPFVFGEVVKGEHFADREEELRSLGLDLASGQNVLLFSPRRYGKTSLIVRVMEGLKAKGLICAYVDFFRATSLQSLGKLYADAITRATASKIEEAIRFIRDHFPTIVPKIVFKGKGPAEFELDFEAPRRDLEKWLDEIFDLPQQIAQRKRKRLVVILDEFQEIAGIGAPGALERAIRSKIQHHDRVAYVFMGSKRHLLDELCSDKSRPLYRIAKPMPLGKIPEKKLATFIHSRFQSAHVRSAPAEIQRILEITLCHPYYTQQLCHETYNVVVPGKQVLAKHIEEATERCVQAQSYAHSTIWDGLSNKQRELVVAISKMSGQNIYSKEFLDESELRTASAVQTSVSALEKKGLVDRDNGSYILSDIFFVEWVKRKIN